MVGQRPRKGAMISIFCLIFDRLEKFTPQTAAKDRRLWRLLS
jgi:hypothetical protein